MDHGILLVLWFGNCSFGNKLVHGVMAFKVHNLLVYRGFRTCKSRLTKWIIQFHCTPRTCSYALGVKPLVCMCVRGKCLTIYIYRHVPFLDPKDKMTFKF